MQGWFPSNINQENTKGVLKPAIRQIKNSKQYFIMGLPLLFNRFGGPNSKEIKEYYIRKTSQGKNEMLVRNNICNKLIHRVFSCVHRKIDPVP